MDVKTLLAARGPLTTRILTGLVLITLAVAAVYFGGTAFTALVALAVLLMFAEWSVMHGLPRFIRLAGLAALAATIFLASYGPASQALLTLGGAALALGLFARNFGGRFAWVVGGVLYCGLPAIALIVLRAQPSGIMLTVWTLSIVWATDIFAYFAGRAIGGPKLAPAISPNKTWAGLGGGVVGAALTAYGVAAYFQMSGPVKDYALIAGGVLAVVAQGGDLFESWMKRNTGVKDSGRLLPGHGGVLDRLDGLVPVAVLSALGFVAVLR
ncbi:phosphatidate cytidylyltransferase [Glacieibacterium frigidum]|uniref:phosphatidate cytidylyltransferase n=1 Tax=Glacieibacterium frigidum TaxID=2593303 RepID=UPI001F2BBDE2|nr:phosphatidate cytidylyltransferase [Glacieibacterium frigidum]